MLPVDAGITPRLRASFRKPLDVGSSSFVMSVDTPTNGPVVVTACTDVTTVAAVEEFGECIAKAVANDRPLVVNLLEIHHIEPPAVLMIMNAALHVARHRSRTVIACRHSMHGMLPPRSSDGSDTVDYRDTLTGAIRSALEPLPWTDANSVSQVGGSFSVDALHGTYL